MRVPGQGSFPNWEKPRDFSRQVLSVMDRVDSSELLLGESTSSHGFVNGFVFSFTTLLPGCLNLRSGVGGLDPHRDQAVIRLCGGPQCMRTCRSSEVIRSYRLTAYREGAVPDRK